MMTAWSSSTATTSGHNNNLMHLQDDTQNGVYKIYWIYMYIVYTCVFYCRPSCTMSPTPVKKTQQQYRAVLGQLEGKLLKLQSRRETMDIRAFVVVDEGVTASPNSPPTGLDERAELYHGEVRSLLHLYTYRVSFRKLMFDEVSKTGLRKNWRGGAEIFCMQPSGGGGVHL